MPILNGWLSAESALNGEQVEPSEALVFHSTVFPGILLQSGIDPNQQRFVDGSLRIAKGVTATLMASIGTTKRLGLDSSLRSGFPRNIMT